MIAAGEINSPVQQKFPLLSTTKTQHKVKGRLLLDVVVRERTTIFQLLASEDEALLVGWNSFFVLDFGLHIFNGVTRLHLEGDGFSSESFDKDLHAPTKTQHKVKGRFLLDVVVRERTTIFQLLTSKDESLLVGWNSFFVLDFGLHIFNGVTRLNLEGDGFSSESFDKDLHAPTKTQHKVKGRFLLDVVVRERTTIFQLLTSKDESLLVGWNSFFVLDFGLHVFNGVTRLNLEGDGFSSESFDKDLHAPTKT